MQQALLHPTYFPTALSFHLLVSRPCLLEVQDNYQKQTYRNRTYIYGANGKQLLTIPILHIGNEHGRQLYKDVRIDNNVQWQKIHWKTLETAYRTTPYFEFYEDELRPLFQKKVPFLLDFNLNAIECLCHCILCDVSFEKTLHYKETYPECDDFRFLTSAKKPFSFEQQEYYQIFANKHGFLPNLSILDILFHEGTNTHNYLMHQVKVSAAQ